MCRVRIASVNGMVGRVDLDKVFDSRTGGVTDWHGGIPVQPISMNFSRKHPQEWI